MSTYHWSGETISYLNLSNIAGNLNVLSAYIDIFNYHTLIYLTYQKPLMWSLHQISDILTSTKEENFTHKSKFNTTKKDLLNCI